MNPMQILQSQKLSSRAARLHLLYKRTLKMHQNLFYIFPFNHILEGNTNYIPTPAPCSFKFLRSFWLETELYI